MSVPTDKPFEAIVVPGRLRGSWELQEFYYLEEEPTNDVTPG